jgi:hypothetical protein
MKWGEKKKGQIPREEESSKWRGKKELDPIQMEERRIVGISLFSYILVVLSWVRH